MNKFLYGLFKTETDYDTFETLVCVSENAIKLRTLAAKKNNENKREFSKRIQYAKKYLGIETYPKSLKTLCEETKWFVRKLEVK